MFKSIRAKIHQLYPHVFVQNINQINYRYLKNEMGIQYLILDKDDTFATHRALNLHNDINIETMKEISEVFKDKVFIVSNSRTQWEIDWVHPELKQLFQKNKSFRRFFNKKRKPLCREEFYDYLKQLYGPENVDGSKMCMIGDRITTDVLFGNRMNSFTVLTEAFKDSKRSIGIEIFRFFEFWLLRRLWKINSVVKKQFNGKEINQRQLLKRPHQD